MLVISLLVLILIVGWLLVCVVDRAKYQNARDIGLVMFFCALLSICFHLRELVLSLR